MPARLIGPHLDAALYGSPSYLGTIVATTTKNNFDTAAAFKDTAGEGVGGLLLAVQPDTACYVLPGTASDSTVTTANGVKLAADQIYILNLRQKDLSLCCLAVSGTTNLKVWELL